MPEPDAQKRPPLPKWVWAARSVVFLLLSGAAVACAALRASGYVAVDEKVLYFLLAAGVLLMLERVIEFSAGKDGISAKLVQEAVEAGVKPVEDEVRRVNDQTKTVEAVVKSLAARMPAVEGLVNQIEQKALGIDKQAAGIGEALKPLQAEVERAQQMVRAVQEVLLQGAARKGAPRVASAAAFKEAAPMSEKEPKAKWKPDRKIVDEDDPQKGRFEGQNVRDGLILEAQVEESEFSPGLYDVTLAVRPLTAAELAEQGLPRPPRELSGGVTFYLHDTFYKPVRRVRAKDGKATLEVPAYGAFTVGAVADGTTPLELDLAELPDAPEDFREN